MTARPITYSFRAAVAAGILTAAMALPADELPPGSIEVRRAVSVPGRSASSLHSVSDRPYPLSMQSGGYPFGYNHGQYPFGAYHGRYPLGYNLGGYRYSFSYPYYSYGTRPYPAHVGTYSRGYGSSYSVFDYGDPGYNLGNWDYTYSPGFGGPAGPLPYPPADVPIALPPGVAPGARIYGGW